MWSSWLPKKIELNKTISKTFRLGVGVRQACILSPNLDNINSEHLMKLVFLKRISNLKNSKHIVISPKNYKQIEEVMTIGNKSQHF